MKIVKIIKNIIIGILGVTFFGIALIMTILLLNYNDYGVSQFGDTSLVMIKEQLSSDNYKKGDLVLVEGKKLENIKVGDEIFAYKLDPSGKSVHLDLGIVGEIHPKENAISFENGAAYEMQFVAGSSSKVYNNIGTYLSIILSKWGFLFLILIPSFLIFVYEFYALIVEIKYGNEASN
jgi:hypothetical protein